MLLPSLEIFVDGGGNFREGIDRYLLNFNKHFNKVYVFEPNPVFYKSYDGSNFEFIPKAIWTHDGKMPFFVSKDARQVGSSLLKNKLCRTKDGVLIHSAWESAECEYLGPDFHSTPIEVECVDFSNWLKNNINPRMHNLTLKLDIEGAEYSVLQKILDDNTIVLVKNLFVEFHQQHLNVANEVHDKLVATIKNMGVNLGQWD